MLIDFEHMDSLMLRYAVYPSRSAPVLTIELDDALAEAAGLREGDRVGVDFRPAGQCSSLHHEDMSVQDEPFWKLRRNTGKGKRLGIQFALTDQMPQKYRTASGAGFQGTCLVNFVAEQTVGFSYGAHPLAFKYGSIPVPSIKYLGVPPFIPYFGDKQAKAFLK